MAEQSISIVVPMVTGNAPAVTSKVTDVVVQNTVTSVAYTDKVTDVTSDAINVQSTGMGEESVPNPNLFHRGQEYAVITESFGAYSFKPFSDTVLNSDSFSRLVNYNRIFSEQQYASDSYKVFYVGKGSVDNLQLSETFTKDYSKIALDTSSLLDTKYLHFTKISADQFIKFDETRLNLNKVKPETLLIGDFYSRIVDYNRLFTDSVDATDDFLGEANIDDDQIASIGKNLVESFVLSDLQSVFFTANKLDLAALTEIRSVVFTKPFLDSVINTDLRTYSLGKVFVEAKSATDLNVKQVSKIALDVVDQQEQVEIWFSKKFLDTGDVSDETRLSATKILSTGFTKSDVVTLKWDAARVFTELKNTSDLITGFDVASTKLDTASTNETVSKYGTKQLNTTFTQSDQFSRTVWYIRNFEDLVDSTDDFLGAANIDDDQIATIGKNTIDYATTSDYTRFDGTKLIIDTTAILNPISLRTTKILADSFTKTDLVVLNPQKVIRDIPTTTDVATKASSKVLVDVAFNTNPISLGPIKILSDSTNYTVDDFSRVVNYVRNFTDLVDATDDFYGSANIDDDQIASFGKNVIDYFATSDAKAVYLSIVKSDSYVVSDNTTFSSGKILADSFTRNEVLSFNTNKQPLDSVTSLEVSTKSAGKTLSDTTNSSDTASKASGKLAVDVFSSTDTSYKNAGKVASETLYTADVLTFLKYINPIFYETVLPADSGFINNQSYFAGAYVEPGYVGTNTYFT